MSIWIMKELVISVIVPFILAPKALLQFVPVDSKAPRLSLVSHLEGISSLQYVQDKELE